MKYLIFFSIFAAGYIVSDFLNTFDIEIVKNLKADVAGMDYYDLKSDYDFKKAVKRIVEDCDVSGYVDGDYLYSGDISC